MTTVPCKARRIERGAAPDLAQLGQDRLAIRRADVGDVRLVERLLGKRRRLHGDRLRRPGVLAGDVGGGHWLLLDVEERLAGLAIEQDTRSPSW